MTRNYYRSPEDPLGRGGHTTLPGGLGRADRAPVPHLAPLPLAPRGLEPLDRFDRRPLEPRRQCWCIWCTVRPQWIEDIVEIQWLAITELFSVHHITIMSNRL